MASRTTRGARRIILLATLGIASLCSAGATSALAVGTTFYASPDGGVNDCPVEAPCAIEEAFGAAADGDTIQLASGTYANLAPLTTAAANLTVQGASMTDKPVLQFAAADGTALALSGGAPILRDVIVTGNSSAGGTTDRLVAVGDGATLERVKLVNTGSDTVLIAKDVTMSNSVVETFTSNDTGTVVVATGAITNSTIRCTSAVNCVALNVEENILGAGGNYLVTVRNSALTSTGGITVRASATLPARAVVNIDDYSISQGWESPTTGSDILDDTTPGTPTLDAPGSGVSHRQLNESHTIDHGDPAASGVGNFDFDGDPRVAGDAPDIGADELRPRTLHVTTTGSADSDCLEDPCTIQKAFAAALHGDIISVAPGDYPISVGLNSEQSHLTLTGQGPGAKPRIVYTTGDLDKAVRMSGTGVALRDIEIAGSTTTATGSTGIVAVELGSFAKLDRVKILSTDFTYGLIARQATVRDSVIWNDDNYGAVVSGSITGSTVLGNPDKGSIAVGHIQEVVINETSTLVIRNSIVRGGSADVANVSKYEGSHYTVDIDYSYVAGTIDTAGNVGDHTEIMGDHTVTEGLTLHNEVAAQDVRQEEGSLTVDAGTATSSLLDFDGDPRPTGTAPDVGADEVAAPVFSGPVTVTGITPTYATLGVNLNANGFSTTYQVDYGTTNTLGTLSPEHFSGEWAPTAASITLTGLAPDTTYYAKFTASSLFGTGETGVVTFTTTHAVAPAVTTGSAINVTTGEATVQGSLSPNDLETTYAFEYGTTTSYGDATPTQTVAEGTPGPVDVSADLSGFAPGTTIHFRLNATNAGGTTHGSDMTFTTGALPAAVTDAASGISTSGATLNATVNPEGLAATVSFEYGATSAYGQSTPVQNLAADAGSTAVTAILTGLASGTTIHYRVVITTDAGTTNGADQMFTTTTPPVDPPVGPPADPAPVLGTIVMPAKVKTGKTTKLLFGLSERATVTITVTRLVPGVRSGGRCRKVTTGKGNCTVALVRGTIVRTVDSGRPASFVLPAKFGRKALAPGVYRITVTAKDLVTGATSTTRTRTLTVTQ